MFSGIVEEVGVVRRVQPGRLAVVARCVLEGTKVGDSIAVNGVCLTVTTLLDGAFAVDLMPETQRRTNLGALRVGDRVNLERALAVGDRIGGHFVQGHVEGTARIVSLISEAGAIIARFAAPTEILRYLVPKGFVAVDGISLTVVDCDATGFTVSLVAHTLENTTLGQKRPGDMVNLECDILAKYVERALQHKGRGITEEYLLEQGFFPRAREV